MRASLFIATLIVICVLSANAQKRQDYVINFNNDTIKCDLQSQLFGLPRYEPLNEHGLSYKIHPDSIKEYRFHNGDHPFLSVKMGADEDRKFLPCLEKGAICLFEMAQTTTTTSGMTGSMTTNIIIKWYASHGQDTIPVVIKTNQIINFGSSKKQRQAAFYNLIAKDADLLKRFKDANDYGFDAIRKAIADYNLRATISSK